MTVRTCRDEHAEQAAVKTCTRCKRVLSATTEFYAPRKAGKFGLSAECWICLRERSRLYRTKHPKKILDQSRAYYRTHPEWSKRVKQTHYAKHREEVKERSRLYRLSNPGYWKLTPEQYKAKSARRRARKLAAGGAFTAEDIARKYKEQNGCCRWCGTALGEKYDADHIIPLARGGSNGPENICLSCKPCNQKKGAKLPHEWKNQAERTP